MGLISPCVGGSSPSGGTNLTCVAHQGMYVYARGKMGSSPVGSALEKVEDSIRALNFKALAALKADLDNVLQGSIYGELESKLSQDSLRSFKALVSNVENGLSEISDAQRSLSKGLADIQQAQQHLKDIERTNKG